MSNFSDRKKTTALGNMKTELVDSSKCVSTDNQVLQLKALAS